MSFDLIVAGVDAGHSSLLRLAGRQPQDSETKISFLYGF
jgi:hypothetical protein